MIAGRCQVNREREREMTVSRRKSSKLIKISSLANDREQLVEKGTG